MKMNFTMMMNFELDKAMKKVITKDALMDKYNEMLEYEDEFDDDAAKNLKAEIVDFLKANNIECSIENDKSIIKEAIQKMKSNKELKKDLIYHYYELYGKTPTCSEILDNIVENLADKDLKAEGVGTKALIVRQFIKHLNKDRQNILNFLKEYNPDLCKYKKIDTQQYMQYINDEMFKKYEIKKLENEDYKVKLLDLANNLYEGFFQSGGQTRSNLYLFGLVFNMKYYHRFDSKFDNIDSLEKQLLFNYYADNMKRYISNEYINKMSSSEHEPSSLGVNFKNYVEFIFVYFMNKTNMSVQDKYNKINEYTKKCGEQLIEEYKNRDAKIILQMNRTLGFEDAMNQLNMKEDNLISYICEKYPLQQYKKNKKDKTTLNNLSVSAIQSINMMSDIELFLKLIEIWDTEEHAYRTQLKKQKDQKDEEGNYILSEEERKSLEKVIELSKKTSKNNNYEGLGFLPILNRNEEEYQDILADKKFIDVLNRMESLLDIEQLNKSLSLSQVSRTSFLTRAFYDFIGNGARMEKPYASLQSLYEHFCDEWNVCLDACRYQCINSKNLYDVYLVYTAYFNLCLSE